MTIVIETEKLPERGPLHLRLDVSTIINIPAEESRRKVGVFVGNEIADLLSGETPDLVWQNNAAFWRVPVVLSTKSIGRIGVVGFIDVDVKSGDLKLSDRAIKEIDETAKRYATGAAY